MSGPVNSANDLSWWTVTCNESGFEEPVQARLWVEARDLGVRALSATVGHAVSQDAVHVVQMEADWTPERYETRVGALKGLVGGGDRP